MARALDGKVIVITGASRGLGQYCARGFAAAGASVVATARSVADLHDTADLIAREGGRVLTLPCDVGDPAAIEAMKTRALDHFGQVDVLMCNAAYFAPGTISTMASDDWERQFRVNVHGVFYAIRAFLPTMIEQGGGTIINVSSVAAQRGSHYGVTKRAVEGMTLAFAEEQAANGIVVTALRPVAAIETPGWRVARDDAGRQARQHRVSPPDSYVAAAVLLAQHAAPAHAGRVHTDAEILETLGDPDEVARFAAMNAPVWRDALSGSVRPALA